MSAKPLDSWISRLGFPESTSDFPEIAIAVKVGAEDFVCWGQWSFRRSDFVSASTRTETTRIHQIFRLGLSFWLKIWYPSWIFVISRKNICVLPGIPRIFSKGPFFVTQERKKQKSNSVFTQLFWGWTRADAWKHGRRTQIRLVGNRYVSSDPYFLEPLWSFKIYAKYMVDTWKTSTHVVIWVFPF